jgi:UDP-N-acetylmuramoyl-tripeptide--D-alanyl-D-alanine ligase
VIGEMTLSELAVRTGGELTGADSTFCKVSTDSRSVMPGDLYLALIGERFNGHEFVEAAAQRGAIAAVVSEEVVTSIPVLQVSDTHKTLGDLANVNRRRSDATVIALTGSQGKTTVKEMTGAILSNRAKTLITSKNLNNTIGVPLTLLRLLDEQFAVIEMGANGAGEIAFSVAITEPDIVLITKASAAHIEGFGSLQGIVEAKGEIIDGLGDLGVAVLNADDDNVEQWLRRAGSKKIILFSLLEKAGSQYFASEIDLSNVGEVAFKLHSPQGSASIQLNMMGQHNVANAVSAAALALEVGANLEDVVKGLASLNSIDGRLKLRTGINGCTLIDDTYNASPDSFFSAIDALMSFSGRRIVIAGDMKELGSESKESHISVGHFAKQAGVDEFWATGDMSKLAVDAFGERALHFESQDELVERCRAGANQDVVFLVKGSRGAMMENIINELLINEVI